MQSSATLYLRSVSVLVATGRIPQNQAKAATAITPETIVRVGL